MNLARPASPAPSDLPIRLTVGPRTAGAAALPAWLALSVFGVPFETIAADADQQGDLPDGAPAHGPVLQQAGLVVWGPLAVMTHLGEQQPAMWPSDRAARAQARSVAAEVASGFADLRAAILLDLRGEPVPDRRGRGLARDVARVRRVVADGRGTVAKTAGPFLFGRFCLADAMLAGLTGDLLGRMLAADPVCRAYLGALNDLPALRAWLRNADTAAILAEDVVLPVEHLVGPEEAEHAERLAEQSASTEPESPAETLLLEEPPPAEPPPDEPSPEEPPPGVPEPAEPVLPPVRPRLEDVDRPKIAYLDEPKSPGWRGLPIVERISGPPPIPPVPARSAAPTRNADQPPEERQKRMPEPEPAAIQAGPAPPSVTRRPAPGRPGGLAEDDNPFLFRLRRPGTTSLPEALEKERDRPDDPPSWSGPGRPIGRPRRR